MTAKQLLAAASLLLFALPATAEEAASSESSTETVAETASDASKGSDNEKDSATLAADGSVIRGSASSAWRGSWIGYEHVSTSVSLDKGAELTWNPYYAHSLRVAPRYYLRPDLFVTGSVALEQELTNSDWTTSKHEVMWSDVSLGMAWSGLHEPTTDIRVLTSISVALPTSKMSQAATQIAQVTPSVRVFRNVPVMGGLHLALSGLWSQRFHRETSPVKDGTGMVGCNDGSCEALDRLQNQGIRNSWGSYSVGPSAILTAMPGLRFNLDFRLGQAFVYDLTEAEVATMGSSQAPGSSQYAEGFNGRYNSYFGLGASYDLFSDLTISASVATPTMNQLRPDGERRSPFFNRFTQFGLGFSVDVDAFASRVFPRG